MAKAKPNPSKDHLFEQHAIVEHTRVETDFLGSWVLKRPDTGSWWCRITATSGRLIVIGDFEPVIFGVCSDSDPRGIVKWIGQCPGDDGYYPPQKAEIGMAIRIAKTARANGIRRDAVFAALAAARRLHALLSAEPGTEPHTLDAVGS